MSTLSFSFHEKFSLHLFIFGQKGSSFVEGVSPQLLPREFKELPSTKTQSVNKIFSANKMHFLTSQKTLSQAGRWGPSFHLRKRIIDASHTAKQK